MNKLAKLISFVLHPVVFFLAIPFIIVYHQDANFFYAVKWEIFSAIFGFLMVLLFLWARRKGIFSNEDITERRERFDFYLLLWIFAVLYLVVVLGFKGLSFSLSLVSFGVVSGILLFAFMNYFIKISIHAAVSCAFVVTMSLLYGMPGFQATFWIVPAVFISRFLLKRHTVKEIFAGGFLGSLIALSIFKIAELLYLP